MAFSNKNSTNTHDKRVWEQNLSPLQFPLFCFNDCTQQEWQSRKMAWKVKCRHGYGGGNFFEMVDEASIKSSV